MIAYASIYGNTENAANVLACRLRELGVKTEMFDVSVAPANEIIAAAFRCSHLVFASATYNGGIFVTMDALLRDLAAHGLQNRTVALMENGSWAPVCGKQMRALLEPMKNFSFVEPQITLRGTPAETQRAEIEALAQALKATIA